MFGNLLQGGEQKHMRGTRNHRHWSRRTSSVPKGYLRSRVLKMLNERPMSGAEIMSAMEEKTGMRWRPSPGSVYPLLSWLLDSGYTRECPDSEAGVRRYELTETGKKLLEEDEQRREQDKGTRFFGQQFEDRDGPMPEEARQLVDSWRNMRRAGFAFRRKLRDDYSDTLAIEAKKLVDDFVEKLSRLSETE
jgi:DNA-binding PadR family transcriptional regulator